MAGGAVFSQVHVKAVVLLLQAHLLHALRQLFVIVLPLAAADDLADAGHQAVHSRHGLSVIVQLHIKCLDFLWIVCDKHRALEDLLSQVALMLCLQVCSPGNLVLELVVVFLQELHCLCVGHLCELGGHHIVEPVQESLVHKGVKEVHLLRRVLQHIVNDIFQHGLRQIHVVIKVRKSHLRLDHPELRRMPCSVGVLCPECGAEGIDIPESLGKGLAVELAADCQVRLLVKEVLGIVHRAVFLPGHIVQVQGGHLEHLSCSLAVASRDQRGVHIHKAPLLKEFVDGVGCQGSHPEHSLEGVRPGAKMGDGPQVFKAVALLLERVVRRGSALHLHRLRLDLKGLLCLGCGHQGSLHDDSSSHVQSGDLREIVHGVMVHHLQGLKEGPVIYHDEPEGLGVPDAAHPAAHGHFLIQEGLRVLI